METLTHNLKDAVMITLFVFAMMLFVDYINVLTKGKMSSLIKGGSFRQYTMASFLGVTPGCLGSFMNISFYIHGIISFGAIVGGMLATSGDEAFIMLALFPGKALLLFGILFILGVSSAYFVDKIILKLKIRPCQECKLSNIHDDEECRCLDVKEIFGHIKKISLVRFLLLALLLLGLFGFISGIIGPNHWDWMKITFVSLLSLAVFIILTVSDHYLEEHIWNHIAKRHIWRIFLWSFGVLALIGIGLQFWNLEDFVQAHLLWVLLLSSLVAIIPESGPHLIFVMMFDRGLIPFSILLTSSIVQDGHGMLPLLSYTVKDSLLIKSFNLTIGLGLGLILFSLGY